jgi:hypothetical protein
MPKMRRSADRSPQLSAEVLSRCHASLCVTNTVVITRLSCHIVVPASYSSSPLLWLKDGPRISVDSVNDLIHYRWRWSCDILLPWPRAPLD